MTEIKLHTYGEKLIVSEKVTLASGNINSAELHVTLDEAWAAYPNISATFETKEYIEPVDVLMSAKTDTEYVCVIPAEVIQKQGVLEIAIRGVSNDGEAAKTSSYARYNIVKGASPGDITLKPTMDLYQQYLAAMDNKTAALFNAYKAEMDAVFQTKIDALEADYQSKTAAFTGDLLWENTNIAAGLSAKDIDLDLSEYKRVLMIYKRDVSNGNNDGYSEFWASEKDILYTVSVPKSGSHHYRTLVVTDTKISVSACTIDDKTDSEHIIPYKFYGFKW